MDLRLHGNDSRRGRMIKFIVDYRGVLTGEKYYKVNTITHFSPKINAQLVDEGRAVYLDASPPTLDELREKAKQAGIKGYARMKKETLTKRLKDA
jgi:hypothetical protein